MLTHFISDLLPVTIDQETSTMDANYVNMGQGVTPGTTIPNTAGLEEPNLSQEERDLRLALALQQQENAAAYDAHKKTHEAAIAARKTRTTRSNASTGLASIRKAQKNNVENTDLKSDGAYDAPGTESSDAQLAAELQKVEHATAGTAQLMEQIAKEDSEERKSTSTRSGRSHYHM
jgi:hypothetical protein